MKILLSVALTLAAGWPAVAGPVEPLPWEVWDDPSLLPRLPAGDQVLLRSSHCPDGCRFDRHSMGDSRFVRLDGDEGVIFEDVGAGAVTRIWMTQGDGDSLPLDPDVSIRVYLDGDETPRIDLPLPDFFSGTVAPFLTPMVGDRLVSSGGNYSYVPIAYRQGCRVSLVGAEDVRIWFQVTYHRLSDPQAVATFTGAENLDRWSALLSAPGDDPWLDDGVAEIATGRVAVVAGDSSTLYADTGAGLITGLRLEAPETAWDDLRLRLVFDGRATVDSTLRDVFAVLRGGPLPTRSLLVGLDALGRLYLYFPMPYFEAVEVRVVNTAAGGDPVEIDYWVRRSARLPADGSGLFGVQLQAADPTVPGSEAPLLELQGYGKWVGLFADVGSVETLSRQYLEGDERIYLDGARHPALYGTGTEDIFGGGFYFDFGPFRQALHGMAYELTMGGERTTGAYRLFLTDAPTFGASIRAGLETGPTGEMPMRTRVVSYYYLRDDPVLARRDVLDLSDPDSRASHQHGVLGDFEILSLDAAFEGEPPSTLEADGYYRQQGKASFTLATTGCLGQPRLRRLLDAGIAGQAATVEVDGVEAASMPPIDANLDRRWREIDVDLAAPIRGDSAVISVVYDDGGFAPPLVGDAMTEFRYELWCLFNSLVFSDGFESGDVSGWSSSVGK
ncbi:MAG: DUF2961 domain-containing protein [Thermoanaerobaculia bacterium]